MIAEGRTGDIDAAYARQAVRRAEGCQVPDDKAREAAEEVATYEEVRSDVWLLKWMIGAVIALVLGVFWMQWQMIDRLAGIEGRVTNVEGRLTTIESKLPPPS